MAPTPFAARAARPIALACAAFVSSLHAQGVATDAQLTPVLAPVTVNGSAARSGLPALLAGSTAARTAEQLREQNLFNPEDALQYAPSTTVRKRYPGDRNAVIAGRSFGTLQPSRALVYLDGYLISNFLGRFDAPRWNMISPEAMDRVDILYGPYSALFPGNSIGTTVAVTQRAPKGFEFAGRLIGFHQAFRQYGHRDDGRGGQLSLRLANRFESGLWLSADLNHQDATSQPMQYHTVAANAAGAFPEVAGSATTVTGIVYDADPKGLKRAVFGASAGAIDHTVQDTLNLRAGMRLTPTLEASAMASWWHNDSKTRNETWLRDAAGRAVWSGVVTDGTSRFEIPKPTFAPTTRAETHRQLGATLKTRNGPGWNASLVVSDYRVIDDVNRQANGADPVASAGSVTVRDGTGWNTAEVQASFTPVAGDWTGGRHALAFGLHRNGYVLDNGVFEAADWRGDIGAQKQFYGGRTVVAALYAQDAWRVADDWLLTLGWREERFRTCAGRQLGGGATVDYAARSLRGSSPKASLAWSASDALLLKASAGRGVRFPNVEELYNGTVTATSQTLSDPNLRAETSDALELSAEQDWDRQRLRVSLYFDDVRDAILRQSTTDAAVCRAAAGAAGYTCVQNVERVKTSGIEFAWSAQDLTLGGIRGLAIDASAAYTFRSEVVANTRDPGMVGKWWLRVPRTRATLQLAWRPDAVWMFSAGLRHQGRAYNDPHNLDANPDVYGGVSAVNQLDLRGTCKLRAALELAAGINNATDQRAWQSHPYPGRTLFVELRFRRQ